MQLTQNTVNIHKDVDSLTDIVRPAGYFLLVSLPKVEEKTKGGIYIPGAELHRDEVAQICAYVIETGPDAFEDEKRFPTGPRCIEGDWIIMKAYAGVRFKVNGEELRIISDDDVLGTLPNGPLKIERA